MVPPPTASWVCLPQPGGTVVAVVVVVRPVLGLQVLVVEHQRGIHEHARRGHAVGQRGRVNEGLEARARLPRRLQSVVVLVDGEVEAADHRPHRAGIGIEGNQGALDVGNLRQHPAVAGLGRVFRSARPAVSGFTGPGVVRRAVPGLDGFTPDADDVALG